MEFRPRGRQKGSIKGDKKKAISLRKQGKSNEEIAKALGVSPRTVTRYFTPESPQAATITWDKLEKLFSTNGKPSESMRLFLLRLFNDPRWKQAWRRSRSQSAYTCMEAVALRRRFEKFLNYHRNVDFFDQADELYQEYASGSHSMDEYWEGTEIGF